MWMQDIKAYCPVCEKEQTFTYKVYLKDIHGGDYEYGTQPGCTVEIEWICEEGFIVETKEFDL